MKISVVIPTYNHRDYVLAAIESVFAQSYREVELIVVNDGSPDDTAELLRPLAESGRIRYVDQTNAGQGAARNRGIVEASGELIALLDDDDLWPADKLERQAALLRDHPNAVAVYGEVERIGPDGRPLAEQKARECPSGDVYDAFRRRCWMVSPGQALFRAEALRAVGGFDPEIWGSDDWDLYIRLARRGPFIYHPEVALRYRLHGGNASRQALRHARNDLKVARKHLGLSLPLHVSHLRVASRYFVPNLLRFGHAARCDRRFGEALRAYGYAMLYRPRLALRPSFVRGVVGSALRMTPRDARDAPRNGGLA